MVGLYGQADHRSKAQATIQQLKRQNEELLRALDGSQRALEGSQRKCQKLETELDNFRKKGDHALIFVDSDGPSEMPLPASMVHEAAARESAVLPDSFPTLRLFTDVLAQNDGYIVAGGNNAGMRLEITDASNNETVDPSAVGALLHGDSTKEPRFVVQVITVDHLTGTESDLASEAEVGILRFQQKSSNRVVVPLRQIGKIGFASSGGNKPDLNMALRVSVYPDKQAAEESTDPSLHQAYRHTRNILPTRSVTFCFRSKKPTSLKGASKQTVCYIDTEARTTTSTNPVCAAAAVSGGASSSMDIDSGSQDPSP
jgi:hypothetical protein